MEQGWFDNFLNKEIDRNINSDGVVSYSIIDSPTKTIDLMEMYFMSLKSSKRTLTLELKRVIDDLNETELNTVWGQTEYTQKTPLGHAIDDINVETVEYLLQKGVDVNKSGTNQKHILQELLSSNATDKRVQILEMVLNKMEWGTIQLSKGFDGNFFSIKYLVPLIDSYQISDNNVKYLLDEITPKQRKILNEQCDRITFMKYENKLREGLSQDMLDIFLF